MKKFLLVGGDSFSDQGCGSYKETDIVTWPVLLAKKLDMELVCVAQSGSGNEQIYSSILDWICENGSDNVGLVLAAWSKCERMDWEKETEIPRPWCNTRVCPKGNLYSWLRKSIRNFYNLQSLCEKENIPYKQFQMISLYMDHVHEYYEHNKNKRNEVIKWMTESPQFDMIDNSNFIGWPIFDEGDGYVVGDVTVHKGWKPIHRLTNKVPESSYYGAAARTKLDYVISSQDPHPNKKGHEMIMEFIHENI